MTLVPIPIQLPEWVGDLWQKMIAPAGKEAGQMGRDLIKYYRAEIQKRFFETFRSRCEKHTSILDIESEFPNQT
jgi:hypothetical protein